MGQSTSKASLDVPASAAGSISQVLGGLVEGSAASGSGRGAEGPTLHQLRRGSSADGGGGGGAASPSWQLEVLRQTKNIHRLTVISYEEFLDNIRQLNDISGRYLDDNGKQLVFAVKRGTDSTILWRATVRIACVKVDAATKSIESCRTLSLKQFLLVYNKLRHQADAVVAVQEEGVCGGGEVIQRLDDVYGEIEEVADKDKKSDASDVGIGLKEECIICLERVPELILPCAHSYCLPCIEQWSVNNKTCPVCRETVDDIDEGWVVSEGPDSLEIATEIQKSLMNLSQ